MGGLSALIFYEILQYFEIYIRKIDNKNESLVDGPDMEKQIKKGFNN